MFLGCTFDLYESTCLHLRAHPFETVFSGSSQVGAVVDERNERRFLVELVYTENLRICRFKSTKIE